MLRERKLIRDLPDLDPDEVDRRLAESWTLPATLYTDPATARLEQDVVWKKAWQLVGALPDFRNAGDYLTVQLGKYPILVVKGKDEEIRAFMNVCRHRGALVVGGDAGDTADGETGNCSRFKCRYHGWTYGLDGSLLGAPDGMGKNLPPYDELGLRPVSVDTWGGLVFVSVAPDVGLDVFLGDVPGIAEDRGYAYPFLNEDMVFASDYEIEVQCNWKLFMENNLECYHCMTTHGETLGALYKVDTGTFCNVNYRNGNHISTVFVDDLEKHLGADTATKLQEIVETTKEDPFQQYWFWPTNMLSTGAGLGDAIVRIDPIDERTCRLIARVYTKADETFDSSRLEEFLEDIVVEDAAISKGVQLGLESGAREWGPLLEGREESIQWISKMIWEHLSPAFRERDAVS